MIEELFKKEVSMSHVMFLTRISFIVDNLVISYLLDE